MARKAKKIAGIILSVLCVLILLLVCVFFFWLGPTVKAVAQHVGSKALGTPLIIQELEIQPHKGTFHLAGFTIANPEEFGRTNAVALAGMDIELDMGSLFSPTVIVHRVQIESPHLIYEHDTAVDNISRFAQNIEAFTGADKKEARKQTTDDAGRKQKEPVKVIVEQLEINDIQLHLAHTVASELDIEVGIEQLALSMTNGTAALKNLHISNPSRLTTAHLFTLAGIAIEMDPESIYSGQPSIRSVKVTRPYAYLENNAQTDTVAEFLKIAERLPQAPPRPAAQESTPSTVPAAEEAPAAPPPVQLHNLVVDDIQVKLLDASTAEPETLAGIGSISLSQRDGRVQIKNISIPNRDGSFSTNLFHLSRIDVVFDPDSIFSEQMNMTKILIDSPEVNLEQTDTGGNIADLQARLTDFVPAVAPDESAAPRTVAEPEEQPEPAPMAELPVVLHELVVTNFTVTLKTPVATNEPAWSLNMADLGKLNPLNKLSLDKLNPLSGEKEDEAEADPDAPLTLVAFQNLSIQPLNGQIRIHELRVANPPGFTRRDLARLEELYCELDPDSLQADTLWIKEIVVTRPRVRYERQLLSDNIKALQKEIEQAAVKETPEAVPEPIEAPDEGRKVIVERVVIAKSSVQAKLSIAPATPPIPLPKITLKDIGREKGGATPAEASSQIIDSFYDTMISAVGDTTGFAGDALKGIGALTLGLPDDETAEADAPADAPETQVSEQESEEAAKRRKRRHPGRAF